VVPLAKKLELAVPLTLQVLRRSHATRNQKRAKDAKMHLGHHSIVTTMNIYTQEIPESVKQMVEEDEALVLRRSRRRRPASPRAPSCNGASRRMPPRCPQIKNSNIYKYFIIMVSAENSNLRPMPLKMPPK
jgi:hypothetical protein